MSLVINNKRCCVFKVNKQKTKRKLKRNAEATEKETENAKKSCDDVGPVLLSRRKNAMKKIQLMILVAVMAVLGATNASAMVFKPCIAGLAGLASKAAKAMKVSRGATKSTAGSAARTSTGYTRYTPPARSSYPSSSSGDSSWVYPAAQGVRVINRENQRRETESRRNSSYQYNPYGY